jgi:hypothetical protein
LDGVGADPTKVVEGKVNLAISASPATSRSGSRASTRACPSAAARDNRSTEQARQA